MAKYKLYLSLMVIVVLAGSAIFYSSNKHNNDSTTVPVVENPEAAPDVTNQGALVSVGVKVVGGKVVQTPHISYISQGSGPVGTRVTVYGSGFSFLNAPNMSLDDVRGGVWLSNGSYSAELIPSSVTGTSFSVTIPSDVCPGAEHATCSSNFSTLITPGNYNFYVKNATTASNYVNFTVTSMTATSPHISSLSKDSGKPGTQVTIYGTGLNPYCNGGEVCGIQPVTIHFGSNATINNVLPDAGGTNLTFTVPYSNDSPFPGAMATAVTPGDYSVSVTNSNGTSNGINFFVPVTDPR